MAFTPHLVGLASELQDQPFHLIASYNQGGTDAKAIHEIFQNGLPIIARNVSVTRSARHPDVTGITYVPYYLVFDHHGDLAYHHQGGPYHGGDRTAVLQRVRDMLKEVPRVYVGKEPYAEHEDLAARIASGKKLGASLKKLKKAREESPEDEELLRLSRWVDAHAERALRRFEKDAVLEAKSALSNLDKLADAYEETPWGESLKARAKSLGDEERRGLTDAGKRYQKFLQLWSRLKPLKGNAGSVRNPTESGFRQANEKELPRVLNQLPEGTWAETIRSLVEA